MVWDVEEIAWGRLVAESLVRVAIIFLLTVNQKSVAYSLTDHEVGPWKMDFFNGPSSWSNFHGLIS